MAAPSVTEGAGGTAAAIIGEGLDMERVGAVADGLDLAIDPDNQVAGYGGRGLAGDRDAGCVGAGCLDAAAALILRNTLVKLELVP
jgi:hypothetical protein